MDIFEKAIKKMANIVNTFNDIDIKTRHAIGVLRQEFNTRGFSIFMVGGAVRDLIMNIESHDIDFSTNATPEEMLNMKTEHINVIPTGIDFGTVTFIIKGFSFEVTTFRRDMSNGRHPEVNFSNVDIVSDLSRRDFTINAIALDINNCLLISNNSNINNFEIIDPFNGIEDIENKIIRSVNIPDDRFTEDPLRMIRAIRFASKFNFNIEKNTMLSIFKNVDLIKSISKERIHDEVIKAASNIGFSNFIINLVRTGMSDKWIFVSELAKNKGVHSINQMSGLKQNKKFHDKDVFDHTMDVIINLEKNCVHNPITKIAALFHDIGKIITTTLINNDIKSINHENEGAKITESILKNLKFSNEDIKNITDIIKLHMIFKWMGNDISTIRDSKIRKALTKINDTNGNIQDMLFDLIHADNLSHNQNGNLPDQIPNIKERIKSIDTIIVNKNNMIINGFDIMQHFNIKPSKEVGEMLIFAKDLIIENPSISKEDILNKLNYFRIHKFF